MHKSTKDKENVCYEKRLLLVSIISVLVLSLAGCGREVDEADESSESGMMPMATVDEPSVTDPPADEKTEQAIQESTEESTVEPIVEPTEAPRPETSTDNTNPAFYNYVNKDTEERKIAVYVENFNVSEAELRTWDDVQWQTALDDWFKKVNAGRWDNDASPYKRIGYTVSEAGNAFSEEYRIEAETVYDVLVAAELYKYNDEIGELYVNGVLIVDDPKNVPINNGDEISIEIYRKR